MMAVLCCIAISLSLPAQKLVDCGTPYSIDLSVGYSIAGIGSPSCGCEENESARQCELIKINLTSTRNGVTTPYGCDTIIVTERWWREQKDLIDFFDPVTCEEYPESPIYPDHYEIPVRHISPGGTIELLMCKTGNFEVDFIVNLSARPSNTCLPHCLPTLSCPVEEYLNKNETCDYVVPNYLEDIVLSDTCMHNIPIEQAYKITQNPPPGTIIHEDLFVEIWVSDTLGVTVASCDISIVLIGDEGYSSPRQLNDITSNDPLWPIDPIILYDTTLNGDFIENIIEGVREIIGDNCGDRIVVHRWMIPPLCEQDSVISISYKIIGNTKPPVFVSVPTEIDDIISGLPWPIQVDILAANPGGDTTGVNIIKTQHVDTLERCAGLLVKYKWTAIDSCGRTSMITRQFNVLAAEKPPIFIDTPIVHVDLITGDPLPIFDYIRAVTRFGDTIYHHQMELSITDSKQNDCEDYAISYLWTVIDECGTKSEYHYEVTYKVNKNAAINLLDLKDKSLEVAGSCNAHSEIVLPDPGLNKMNIVVSILDSDKKLLEVFEYQEAIVKNLSLGTNYLVYQVVDSCGFESVDTILMVFSDTQAPIFDCPSDITLVISDPNECSIQAIWQVPSVVDECDLGELKQISGPERGATVGSGRYTIGYEAIDLSGNRSVCYFDLLVVHQNTRNLHCRHINLSVDESCRAILSPHIIYGLEETDCLPNLELEIIAADKVIKGGLVDLADYVGQKLVYKICDLLEGNCCEGSVLIEDKRAPVLSCVDTVFLSCFEDFRDYRPVVIGECSDYEWIMSDPILDNKCHQSAQAIYQRSYNAIDQWGNRSEACTTTIVVRRINLDSLVQFDLIRWPTDTTLDCKGHDVVSISKTIFGHPYVFHKNQVITIHQDLCQLNMDYQDHVIIDLSCKKWIHRKWTLIEWHCNGSTVREHIQKIIVEDTTPPEISIGHDTLVMYTSEHSCGLSYTIPAPLITDNCQDPLTLRVSVLINDAVNSSIGHHVILDLGINKIQYQVRDDCENSSTRTQYIVVNDRTPPVPICLANVVVALGSHSQRVYATHIDNGSYDNCEIDRILITRKEAVCDQQDTTFRDFIHICCEDIGSKISVWLKVIDRAGNENICDALIDVQDKFIPVIQCPADLTIACDFPLFRQDIEDPYGHLFGSIRQDIRSMGIDRNFVIDSSRVLRDGEYFDICPRGFKLEVQTEENLNQCGVGYIKRIFSATDASGNTSEPCTQTISIRRRKPIISDDISWPDSLFYIEACKRHYPDPAITGAPRWDEISCSLLTVSYQDSYASIINGSDGMCAAVIRRWAVIDWCDPAATPLDFVQKFKFTDTINPIIELHDNPPVFYSNNNCDNAHVILRARGNDNCTSIAGLVWRVELDRFNNGSLNDVDSRFIVIDTTGVILQQSLPIGHHRVVWTLSDPCGNQVKEVFTFEVRDTTLPVPYAINLHTSLMETGMVELWASDFDRGSYTVCGGEVQLALGFKGQSFDATRSVLIFDCDRLGENMVDFYAFRYVNDQIIVHKRLTVMVTVNDPLEACKGHVRRFAEIKANVSLIDDRGMKNVGVHLVSSDDRLKSFGLTANDGSIVFNNLPIGDRYTLYPQYDGDILEGVSTSDVIWLQRYLMGLHEIENMYQFMAADINKDGRVTLNDVLELRRVIVGTHSEFRNNEGWRFTTLDEFSDRTDTINSMFNIPSLNANTSIDIYAIKVGDVNGSIISDAYATNRSTQHVNISDQPFVAGENVIIPLSMSEARNVYGYQMEITYDLSTLLLRDIKSPLDGWSSDNWHHDANRGLIRISWSGPMTVNLLPLIELHYDAIQDGHVGGSIGLSANGFKNEVYFEEGKSTLSLFKEPSIREAFICMPNPFSEYCILSIPSSIGKKRTINIWDLSGQLIYSTSLSNTAIQYQIHGDQFNKGAVYIVQIAGDKDVVTGKILRVKY